MDTEKKKSIVLKSESKRFGKGREAIVNKELQKIRKNEPVESKVVINTAKVKKVNCSTKVVNNKSRKLGEEIEYHALVFIIGWERKN